MKKRAYYGVCGCVLAVSACVMAYCQFILKPVSERTYQIFFIQFLNFYAVKPLFWLCLGLVFSLAFVRMGPPFRTFCRIFLWAGLALAAAYAVCAACWFAGVQVWFVRPALRLAEYAAPAFLIPGVLIGAGLEKAEFKH